MTRRAGTMRRTVMTSGDDQHPPAGGDPWWRVGIERRITRRLPRSV